MIRRYLPRGQMNKLETEYSDYLHTQQMAGEINSFAYEPETLRLGPDCRYTPDFRVVRHEMIEFHEVKGSRKKTLINGDRITGPYVEDDALVKIKAASELHPYKFIMVWKDGQEWQRKEIN